MGIFSRKPKLDPRWEAKYVDLGCLHYRTITGRAPDEQAARELFDRRQSEMFPGAEYPFDSIQRV